MKEALNERDDIISQMQEEKHNFEILVNNLEETKRANEMTIKKLSLEVDNLKRTCIEQENNIKELNKEKKSNMEQLNTQNFDNKNLNQKLKSTIDNLNSTVKQLNDANKTILKLDEELGQADKELNLLKNDNISLNNNLANERRLREEFQDKTNRLELALKGKVNDIKNMNNEMIHLNSSIDQLKNEKTKTNNEIIKYKEHIMFLTETNQRLINELENVAERDQQLKQILSQGNDIPDFLNKTRNDIDNALNNLEMGLSIQKFD